MSLFSNQAIVLHLRLVYGNLNICWTMHACYPLDLTHKSNAQHI